MRPGLFIALTMIVSQCSAFTTFQDFVNYYNKEYENDFEYIIRETIFEKNQDIVLNHIGTHTLSLNQFADRSPEEFQALMKGFKKTERNEINKANQ